KSEDPQPWAIGVRLDDVNGPFGQFLSKTSQEWHKTGYLIDLEKKWGITPSPFLVEMHNKYAAKSPVFAACMTITEAFQHLNDAYGINLSVIYDPFDRERFVHGLGMTLLLSVVSMALSVVIGAVGAWILGGRSRLLRWVTTGFVEAFRNTPP